MFQMVFFFYFQLISDKQTFFVCVLSAATTYTYIYLQAWAFTCKRLRFPHRYLHISLKMVSVTFSSFCFFWSYSTNSFSTIIIWRHEFYDCRTIALDQIFESLLDQQYYICHLSCWKMCVAEFLTFSYFTIFPACRNDN